MKDITGWVFLICMISAHFVIFSFAYTSSILQIETCMFYSEIDKGALELIP